MGIWDRLVQEALQAKAFIEGSPLLTAALLGLGALIRPLLTRLWAAMPWQRVPLPEAAAYVLGKTEDAVLTMMARREADADGTLRFIASYIAHNAPIEAFEPPSRERKVLTREMLSQGSMDNGGATFTKYGKMTPTYTGLTVRRWRQWFLVRSLRRQDERWMR